MQCRMLTRRILLRKKLLNLSCANVLLRKSQHSKTEAEIAIDLDFKGLPALAKRQPKKEPFMKNLFLGKLNGEMIYFPEPQTSDRHREYFDWLKAIEKCVSEVDVNNLDHAEKKHILNKFKILSVLRSCMREEDRGLGLSRIEEARLLETVSHVPWLGTYMVKNNISPIEIITKYGTADQRAKYLPQIASGELIPTVCVRESESGPNLHTIQARATPSPSGDGWLLTGEKQFVTNGIDANLFIVFAHCSDESSADTTDKKSLTAFIVERDFGGVNCKEYSHTVGLQNMPMCTMTFDDTPVTHENVLGAVGSAAELAVDLFIPGYQNTAPQAVATLRIFLNLLISNITNRKHLDQNMLDLDVIKEVVGNLTCSLYAMESVLYYTAGLEDDYEGQDVTIERAIMESYCARECVTSIYKGLEVIGANSYLRSQPYIRLFEDALAFTTFEGLQYDADTYLALLGLHYAGQRRAEDIRKLRNPLQYHKISSLFGSSKPRKKQTLFVVDYLHPSLNKEADTLEICLLTLQEATDGILKRHGALISERSIDLRRIAELARSCYVLLAVLSRVSKAYCDGMRHSHLDTKIAAILATKTDEKVKKIIDEFENGELENGDELYKMIAEAAINNHNYFPEHPLARNF